MTCDTTFNSEKLPAILQALFSYRIDTVSAPQVVRLCGYNRSVTGSHRDDFFNNDVGDLVPTERGWVVVPPRAARATPSVIPEVIHLAPRHTGLSTTDDPNWGAKQPPSSSWSADTQTATTTST
jgi:hypothetical protein